MPCLLPIARFQTSIVAVLTCQESLNHNSKYLQSQTMTKESLLQCAFFIEHGIAYIKQIQIIKK